MGVLDVLKISASALRAQRTRMEVVAGNLANSGTTQTEEGGPYKKKEVVFSPADVSETKDFGSLLSERVEGVRIQEIAESSKPFEQIYDPGHPNADPRGYVMLPNVNVMEEMADMMSATRSYEANLNSIQAAKEMFLKSLEIAK